MNGKTNKVVSYLARSLIGSNKAKDCFESRCWFINSDGGEQLYIQIPILVDISKPNPTRKNSSKNKIK